MSEPLSKSTEESVREYIPVEPFRDDLDSPCLEWITVAHPDDVYLLQQDDHVLDSYYNPEYDTWEALVLLNPETEEAE